MQASNLYATARYNGTRGNDIYIRIQSNTANPSMFDVSTILDGVAMDAQTVADASELTANDYVTFTGASLSVTAGTPLTGGANGAVTAQSHADMLTALESYAFDTLACLSGESAIKDLYADHTRNMRDDYGIKFQCVLHKYSGAAHEGLISVENNQVPELVAWVTGASAGCPVNQSLSNAVYDGELTVNTSYSQAFLADALRGGRFIFHRVNDEARVLGDINTFTAYTDDKGADFSHNQVIRVIDRLATDIAAAFNAKYIGKIQNDASGRASFWSEVVSLHEELANIRAIENFKSQNITVEQGAEKHSVIVTDILSPVSAMEQLYMTIVVQ